MTTQRRYAITSVPVPDAVRAELCRRWPAGTVSMRMTLQVSEATAYALKEVGGRVKPDVLARVEAWLLDTTLAENAKLRMRARVAEAEVAGIIGRLEAAAGLKVAR